MRVVDSDSAFEDDSDLDEEEDPLPERRKERKERRRRMRYEEGTESEKAVFNALFRQKTEGDLTLQKIVEALKESAEAKIPTKELNRRGFTESEEAE